MPRNIFQVTVNLPASFRNNINNNEVFNPYVFVRNRLYHFVFHRFALLYARLLSDVHRKLIEFLILLTSLFCFITLVYVHVVFVQTPMTCLDGYKDVWQRNGILRVEVLRDGPSRNYSLQDSYWKEKTLRLQHFDGQSYYFYTEQAAKEEEAKGKEATGEEVYWNASLEREDGVPDDSVFDKAAYFEEAEKEEEEVEEKGEEEGSLQPVLEESIMAAEPENAYIMEFSLEYGFLRLRPTKRRELNISVTFVVLDPEVDQCFGGSFNRFLLDTFLGYDNVLLASIKKMAEKKDQKGFVRNAVMDIEYIFINNWTNEKSYITAGFVMIIFTLTISTLLRHSHHQIFIVVGFWMNYIIASFGRPRMNMWPRNLIPSSGAPVLTVILALVGMEAVMSDFFHDRSIALYVIVIVWFADLYDAVCCQSALSKRHWFRFFYLYHFLFYAYNYKFGGVYWPLTLTTSWLFTLHSMVFFFHHYELPRFLHRAARMTAAQQAANNARQPGNLPAEDRPPENEDAPEEPEEDNPDNDDQDNDEQDPPDNDPDQASESTPETEDDEVGGDNEQPDSSDQPGTGDQPESSDQSGCEDQPGPEDQPGSGDQSGSEDQPGTEDRHGSEGKFGSEDPGDKSGCVDQLSGASQFPTDQPDFSMQPIPISQPGFTCQNKFRNELESADTPLPIHLSRSGAKPKFTSQFESKDQLDVSYQNSYMNQLSSSDQPNLGHQGRCLDQLSSLDQPNLSCQGKFTDQLSSTDQPIFNCRNRYMNQLSSLDQLNLSHHGSYTDQASSTDHPMSESLVPHAIATNCVGLHGNCGKCGHSLQKHVGFDENFLEIDKSSLRNEAVPFLSEKVLSEVTGHLNTQGISSSELERFYNFAHKILDGRQGPASQMAALSPKKSLELCVAQNMLLTLFVSFFKSPSLWSCLVGKEIAVPCLRSSTKILY